jgi:hypothetical protein
MRKVVIVAAGLALVGSISACARGGGGVERVRPDEFAVARQAPLVIPPDFALVPPAPGSAPVRDTANNSQTLEALFGANQARSSAERSALDQAGASGTEPGIRSVAGDPGTNVIDKGQTTRDIVAAPAGDGQDARAATPGTAPATTPR